MRTLLRSFGIIALLTSLVTTTLKAQEDCAISQDHGQGYTSSISSVIDNGNGSYTIKLIVSHNGCWFSNKLRYYTVQATPGTYSDIHVTVLSGNVHYSNIQSGPWLWGEFFPGFRINHISGMGRGHAGSFSVEYTVTGDLQDQYVRAHVFWANQFVHFDQEDFQAVLDCGNPPENPDILPYYPPLDGGKSYDIIGSELTSLFNSFTQSGDYISNDIFQIVGSSVIISIHSQPGQYQNAMDLLTSPAYGLTQPVGNPSNNLISGIFPIENLISLNSLPELLVSASPIYAGITNAGLVTSQGDKSLRSNIARDVFSVAGAGIKVGVLSDSYNTIAGSPATDDVIKGELPGVENTTYPTPVDVLSDYPYGTRSDEGRAMLQIVHDIAPGADLAFRTGFLGPVDFAAGIHELQGAGCNVIVDDVTYISEPFFRDGVVAQAVDSVASQGVAYFSAAGNFGTHSWQATFNPSPAPDGIVGEANNFAASDGGIDLYQHISLYQGQYTVVLQWDDGTPGNTTNSDFDIYLANEDGSTLFGFNRVNTGGAALEVLPFTVVADSAESNFLITRVSGSGSAILKYIVYRGDLVIDEYDTPGASTITGQANAEGAMAVGAVLFSNTPEYGVLPPTVASFSSRGGTSVDGVMRLKPDFCAPNGVNTSVDLGGVNIDGDAFPNFFGTSASAPHAAGIAALLMQANQKYYDDNISPIALKGILQSTAYDMNTPGYDPATGAGYILADSALQTLANPKALLSGISYDTTLTPGLDSILVTIYGEYLSNQSSVRFNGEPVDSPTIFSGDTSITTVIPPYDELYPAIQVYNPPKAGTNGLDGGLSNPLYFNTKQTILVNIDDKSKKYGEVLPEFTASYTLENVNGSFPLDSAGLAPEVVDRIHVISLTTVANNLSNVGLWGIETDSDDPLSPNSGEIATDPMDIALLQQFDVLVQPGLLTINPLDLFITPRDTTFAYNDSIAGFNFDYIFNNDSAGSIFITPDDSLAIASSVRMAHGTALVNRPALVRGTALVNSDGEELLNETVLTNRSATISHSAYLTRGTALVNGEAIDPQEFYNATALSNNLSPGRLVRGTALVNAYQLVRGTALVNTIDTAGNVVNTTPLTNSNSLVNGSAELNSNMINADSNTETLVILGEGDIAILSGDSIGNVVIRSINIITGDEVGTHIVVPGSFLTNNFNVHYGVGNFTVLPGIADFSIDPGSLIRTYDGTPKLVGVTVNSDVPAYTVTYNGDTIPPTNAGTYAVEVLAVDTNYIGSASATLIINPDTALVSTGIYGIDNGDPLPAFSATIEGLANADDSTQVSSISFELNPGNTDEAGTYTITPTASAPNYIFIPVTGTLYINSTGYPTKPVDPQFLCRETLDTPDVNGFSYIAHFGYYNYNSTTVYVPKGDDNKFIGVDRDETNLPEAFLPGYTLFDIPYAGGGTLEWEIRSNKSPSGKQTNTAIVNPVECNDDNSGGGPKSADNPGLTEEISSNIYPNPSTGKVFLKLIGKADPVTQIDVYDYLGRKCHIHSQTSSKNLLEIDLTGMSNGLYIIRVTRGSGVKSYNVVIE